LKRRNSLRMPGYNYDEPGIYFITIVTKPRRNLFWTENIDVKNLQESLNDFGIILKETLLGATKRYKNVEILNFIIMPDHIHLLVKNESINISVSQVVRWIKSQSSLMIRKNKPNISVWQRSYYDHIVRNQRELELCNSYIDENPNNWRADTEENNPF